MMPVHLIQHEVLPDLQVHNELSAIMKDVHTLVAVYAKEGAPECELH